MTKVWKQGLWPFFVLGLLGAIAVDNAFRGSDAWNAPLTKLASFYEGLSSVEIGLDSALAPITSRAVYDATKIGRIKTTSNEDEVNRMLGEGFVLIAVAAGVNALGEPYNLYSLGLSRS